MDYIELSIELDELHPWREVVLSVLVENGYESFVETKTGLQGYIVESNFKDEMIQKINQYKNVINIESKLIKDQNWNAKWEENFDPVFVDDLLAIVAPFHKDTYEHKVVINIQPKMSFGTGHHQTTWLMSKRLFNLSLDDVSLLDMGTGTGVLAILAEKLGAKEVYAPDIDIWSFENAIENIAMNNCSNIDVAHGGHSLIENKSFDIVLANINKNILIEHFSVYSKVLNPKGKLLISGFFETDKDQLVNEAKKHGFIFEEIFVKEGWALLEFRN